MMLMATYFLNADFDDDGFREDPFEIEFNGRTLLALLDTVEDDNQKTNYWFVPGYLKNYRGEITDHFSVDLPAPEDHDGIVALLRSIKDVNVYTQ